MKIEELEVILLALSVEAVQKACSEYNDILSETLEQVK